MDNRYIFGKWESNKIPLTAKDAADIVKTSRQKFEIFREYPVDKTLRILGKAGELWKNPHYPLRKKAVALLPEETGFSKEMIEIGLRELCWMLDPELIKRKVDSELRRIPGRSDYTYNPDTQTLLRWEPLGTMFHVLSGNVFLVCAGSLIEGLVTGNVNIVKVSSSEKIFPNLFLQSLKDCDEEGILSKSVAVLDFPSNRIDLTDEFKKNADAVVVWGGEEAVKAYRSGLPARTKLIIFGPKLSFAVVTKGGFEKYGPRFLAEKLAEEVSIWDQRACTAPQVCYVEGGENARKLLDCIVTALSMISKKLPAGKTDPDTAVEIRKLRSVFEIAQSRGEGILKESARDLDWTAVLDNNISLEPSPLHRTVRILPFNAFERVEEQLYGFKGYLQTAGVAFSEHEIFEKTSILRKCGILRIVNLGEMASGEIDDPHDGTFDLPQMMNLVVERIPILRDADPIDVMPAQKRAEIIDSRLRLLIDRAAESPFYSKLLKNLKINSADDLVKIPVLTRREMEQNMPPQGMGLFTPAPNLRAGSSSNTCQTGTRLTTTSRFNNEDLVRGFTKETAEKIQGGYVSRSGGTTGKPKFSIYDGKDWEEMISNAVRVLRACGLTRGDRLANCFMAGDLYGSFVSFDHINCRIGVLTFGFAANATPEVFADVCRKFSVNSVQGIPAAIMPLIRKAKELEPSLCLEKIIFAGSPMSRTDREWLKSRLGAKRISSVIGANDGGQIAYQCEFLEDGFHHLVDDFNYVEILDEKGRKVKDGEPGRIVITSLLKYAFPLIRYDIGDAGRIIPGKCKCGRTARILEFLGRAGDEVAVGCMNLKYADVRNALYKIPFSELQVAAGNSLMGEIIYVRVETPQYLNPEIKNSVYNALLKTMPVITERLGSGKLHKLEVEIHKPGNLERNSRSRKIKNVVDERT